MNHLKWCLGVIGYICVPWMAEAARDLYGTVDLDTGKRVYTRAYLSMAKKNAKSSVCGWFNLYHLAQQHRPGNRAISVATTRKQASEVFDGAASLITGNQELQKLFHVVRSTKTIVHKRYQTRYEVLSGDGDENDGVQSSQWIRDELHRFKTERAIALMEAVERSSRGKQEHLGIDITTAGDPTESRPWLTEYEYAKGIQSGRITNRKYYVRIYEADPERLRAEPDYWKSKEARLAGNPSHEDHGGFIRDEELVEDLERAIESPAKQRGYWRFTINAMAESEGKMFYSDDWKACGKPTAALLGRRCFVGLDLSTTTDLSALVALFPDDEGEIIDVLPFFFVPKERVPAIAKMLGPYSEEFRKWVRDGLIEATPGNQVDYRAIERKIEWIAEEFELVEIDFDRYNATDLVQRIRDKNIQCVEVPQGVPLSAAIKDLQARVLSGKIRHGGHPVLSWMATCAKAKQDPNENMRLVKANRNEEAARVDGIAAILTAMHRMLPQMNKASVYEERDMIVL